MRLFIRLLVVVLFVSCSLFLVPSAAHAAVFYVHSDHLGSVSLVTNEQGAVVDQEVFYPYGETRSAASGTSPTDRSYTAQVSDQDVTGLYYYNARYYSPLLGKFTQADTVQDGLNRYAYVGNNPINATDPSGHMLDYGRDMGGGGGSSLPNINFSQYWSGAITSPARSNLYGDIGSQYYTGISATEPLGGSQTLNIGGTMPASYSSYDLMTKEERDLALIASGIMIAPMAVAGAVSAPPALALSAATAATKVLTATDALMDTFDCLGGYSQSCGFILPDLVDLDAQTLGVFHGNLTLFKGIKNLDPDKPILPGFLAGNPDYGLGTGTRSQYPADQAMSHVVDGVTNRSPWSSWSPNRRVAERYAGPNGTIVTVQVNPKDPRVIDIATAFNNLNANYYPKITNRYHDIQYAWMNYYHDWGRINGLGERRLDNLEGAIRAREFLIYGPISNWRIAQ